MFSAKILYNNSKTIETNWEHQEDKKTMAHSAEESQSSMQYKVIQLL